jgi:hypothetical protein
MKDKGEVELHVTDSSLSNQTEVSAALVISLVLRLSLLISFLIAVADEQWRTAFLSLLALVGTFLPALLERNSRLVLPAGLELMMIGFVYATLFLGEVEDFYYRFAWWDIVLHAVAGLTFGFVAYVFLYIPYRRKRLAMEPILLVLLSFSVAMAIGSVWEIFEFIIDQTFGLNMQKSGLVDTMWDLISTGAGALAVSVCGYFYITLRRMPIRAFHHAVDAFVQGDAEPSLPRVQE